MIERIRKILNTTTTAAAVASVADQAAPSRAKPPPPHFATKERRLPRAFPAPWSASVGMNGTAVVEFAPWGQRAAGWYDMIRKTDNTAAAAAAAGESVDATGKSLSVDSVANDIQRFDQSSHCFASYTTTPPGGCGTTVHKQKIPSSGLFFPRSLRRTASFFAEVLYLYPIC